MRMRNAGVWVTIAMLMAPALASADEAEKAPESGTWLVALAEAPVEAPAEGEAKAPAPPVPPEAAGWSKPIPIGFSIDYTIVSDYVWRGINLSEYKGEGREKVNQQMGVGISYDAGRLGTFSGSFWFEWYSGQDNTAFGGGKHHLQEVDYTLSWSYDIPETPLSVELGWIAYQFPFLKGDPQWTHEVYVSLSLDDGALLRLLGCNVDGPILSPYVTYYHDVDDVKAGWLEIGVSHEFALAALGMSDVPILKDTTLTPSLVLGIDHNYYDKLGVGSTSGKSTRLGNLLYGLDVTVDLSSVFGIPETYGSLSLTGFLRFSQPFHDESAAVQDEFYGGVTLGYEW